MFLIRKQNAKNLREIGMDACTISGKPKGKTAAYAAERTRKITAGLGGLLGSSKDDASVRETIA